MIVGKKGDKVSANLKAKVLNDLAAPIFCSRRNITCDQYLNSVALFEELFQSRLIAAGTVVANHKHLQPF